MQTNENRKWKAFMSFKSCRVRAVENVALCIPREKIYTIYFYFSNQKLERLVDPLDEMETVYVHKNIVTMCHADVI